MTTVRERESEIQKATDAELEGLARGPRGGGIAANGRSTPDLARMELERRAMTRAVNEKFAQRRRDRAEAKHAPPPDPLAKLTLHGVAMNDQDLRALRGYIEGTIRDLMLRWSVGYATVEPVHDGEEEENDGH